MKENKDQSKNIETDTRENPPYYKIDNRLAVEIWEVLHKEGYRYIADSLAEAMIEQGCQEIDVKDASQILAFWKDYLEKNKIIKIGYK